MADVRELAKLFQSLEDEDSHSEDEMDRRPKRLDDKGGEDPLFKAVLKVRPRLPQGTTAESTAITKQSPLPSSIHQTQAAADGIDSELDDDERERRRMERQEMKRRQKAVLAARAEEAAIRAREEGQASVKREELERGGEWDPKAIWTDEEVPHRDLTEDDYKDDRTEPEYEILYKQAVTAQDTFLNMGLIDPSSNSCNELVVRVKLPGETLKKVDLQVTDTKLYVTSSKHKLFLHLPHRCNSDKGTAKWDSGKEHLSVTLPIIRDDF